MRSFWVFPESLPRTKFYRVQNNIIYFKERLLYQVQILTFHWKRVAFENLSEDVETCNIACNCIFRGNIIMLRIFSAIM